MTMRNRRSAAWLGAAVFLSLVSQTYAGIDALNTNLTILVALDKVERALICREGDGSADRNAILRVIGQLDLWCDHENDWLVRAPDWATVGIRGGVSGLDLAYARLLRNAGTLYGFPEYAARGIRREERLRADNGPVLEFRDGSKVPSAVQDYYRLVEEERCELMHTIRPGEENGGYFWNVNAKLFIYPPSFDFEKADGAVKYRFRIMDDVHRVHEFESGTSQAPLTPVWSRLPVGFATVSCRAVGVGNKDLGLVGVRRFWRSAPFDPLCCKPTKRTYAAARRLALEHLLNWPEIAYLESHGHPDISQGSNFTSYPSKMQEAVIRVMLSIVRDIPERRERALRIARLSADYLLSTCEPAGTPLEGFTATYVGSGQLSGTYSGQHMLVYPATGGTGLLAIYGATKDGKYLEAAKRIGDTYVRLQGEDGTWYLKMNAADGTPVSGNRLVPTSVMVFLDDLYQVVGDERYRKASDRAFEFIERGPLVDWDWEGQFEDIAPSERRYQNLTKHMPCEVALHVLRRFPEDRRRLAQARDILRFAEDQFVMWKAPCRADWTGPWMPIYPFFAWRCPAVLEQYSCYSPIDSSAVKLIRTYLALYEAEGRALDLAKAHALGHAIVNNQDDNGRIRTYWIPEAEDRDDPLAGAIRLPLGGDWYNCMASDALALDLLERVDHAANSR